MEQNKITFTAEEFRENLGNTEFINKIQVFKLDMWSSAKDKMEGKSADISQENCVIAKDFVATSDFNTWGVHELYPVLQQHAGISPQTHYMLTYEGMLEPVPDNIKVYNRNMELLYPHPQSPDEKDIQKQLKSAEKSSVLADLPVFRMN